jgi:hypothetical protein
MDSFNRHRPMSPEAESGRTVVLVYTLLVVVSAGLKTLGTLAVDSKRGNWFPIIFFLVTTALCFMLWKGDTFVKWLFVVQCLIRGVTGVIGLFVVPLSVGSLFLLFAVLINLSFAVALVFSSRVDSFFEYQRETEKF